ncbi:MAG: hypothetical protein K2P95_00410, partial [Hyphomonadaceae bacterium]|nr:hypothetical protein [Hyphomonadaceae bacterium]
PGRSMFVRLSGPDSGPGAAGHWTDAASAEHGDLLDVIRESCGFVEFRDVANEARRFLSLPRAESLLGQARQRFDRSGERLELALSANARAAEAALLRHGARLRPQALQMDLERRGKLLEDLAARLNRLAVQHLQLRSRRTADLAGRFDPLGARALANGATRLGQTARMLESLSHRGVLARGYALVRGTDGAVVRRAGDLVAGQGLELELMDGAVGVVVAPGGVGGKKRERGSKTGQGTLF